MSSVASLGGTITASPGVGEREEEEEGEEGEEGEEEEEEEGREREGRGGRGGIRERRGRRIGCMQVNSLLQVYTHYVAAAVVLTGG